jgi:hypothetical protein
MIEEQAIHPKIKFHFHQGRHSVKRARSRRQTMERELMSTDQTRLLIELGLQKELATSELRSLKKHL